MFCSHCGTRIDETYPGQAAACPRCGMQFTAPAPAPLPRASARRPEPDTSATWVILAGAVSLVAVAAVLMFALKKEQVETPRLPQKEEAMARGEAVLKAVLRYPFDSEIEGTRAVRDVSGWWTITGFVRAPNGFGVKLRQDWAVECAFDGKSGHWRTRSFRLGKETRLLSTKVGRTKQEIVEAREELGVTDNKALIEITSLPLEVIDAQLPPR